MKKQIFRIMMIIFLLLVISPITAKAEETTDTTEYAVTITAKHTNNQNRTEPVSNISVMISREVTTNGETTLETVAYGTTNKNGVVTFNLPNGTYTAVAGNTYGNYSYYGIETFTVNGEDKELTINVDYELNYDAAEEIYNDTTNYDHVDVRVNGTFTTGTQGNLVTHSIKLTNVELLVVNDDNGDGEISEEEIIIDTHFEDDEETYEWRVTRQSVPKTATVSLIFDIVLDGTTVRENYTASFSGKEDFIEAIINCDQNQGLDFIIDPVEIIEAAFYNVSYEWVVDNGDGTYSELPSNLATLPTTTKHAPNSTHTIDTVHKADDVVTDTIVTDTTKTTVVYTFSGWTKYSNSVDQNNNPIKNDVGNLTSLTITNDTVIYGVWTKTIITEPIKNYLVIEKTFNGNDSRLPEDLTFIVTESNTGTTYRVEIPLNSFTYDEETNVYTYRLPIYSAGTYTVQELNYDLKGYTFDTENSTNINQTVTTDLTNEVKVTFKNIYIKNQGVDFHNSGFAVEKADAANRTALSGAIFTLTDSSGKIVDTVTTNESGYAVFMNLTSGTYTLKETKAPNGYYLNNTEYTVLVTLVSSYEVYSATQNAYLMQYEYDVTITPDDHYNYGASRITVYNTKITGNLTISKDFSEDSDINKENFPEDKEITVTITGENNYNETIILNSSNNWTETLTNLELGKYEIKELTDNATIDGYDLVVNYGSATDLAEVTLTETNIEEEITITNTYTKTVGTGGEEDKNDETTDVPQTGDSSNLKIYFMIMLFSIAGSIYAIIKSRKNLMSK